MTEGIRNGDRMERENKIPVLEKLLWSSRWKSATNLCCLLTWWVWVSAYILCSSERISNYYTFCRAMAVKINIKRIMTFQLVRFCGGFLFMKRESWKKKKERKTAEYEVGRMGLECNNHWFPWKMGLETELTQQLPRPACAYADWGDRRCRTLY